VYWTVAPFTNYEFCTEFLQTGTFFASNVSSTQEGTIRNWDLIPSVVAAGNEIRIESEDDLLGANFSMRDITGKLLMNDQIKENTISIPSSWSTGIYFVQIQVKNTLHTQKIVIR